MLGADYDVIGLEFYYSGEEGTLQVHGRDMCSNQDRACCIHAPSSHPLAVAPLVWDGLKYLMYRKCEHGHLHPDPDHLGYVEARERTGCHTVSISSREGNPFVTAQEKHTCDGCCGSA